MIVSSIKNYYFNVYSPTVEANRIKLCVRCRGELWVGTAVGLFRYVFERDSFEQVPSDAKPNFMYPSIKAISTGELWVSSQNGIYILGLKGAG